LALESTATCGWATYLAGVVFEQLTSGTPVALMSAVCTLFEQVNRGGRLFLAAAIIGLWSCAAAHALIVGNVPDVVPNTAMNPADYPGGDEDDDPGWDNVSAEGSNYVYLGDGWVLSARHVGYDPSTGVRLQTYLPNGSPGPVKSFFRIPSSYYLDYGYGSANPNSHQYAVSNPTTITSETGNSISLEDSTGNGTHFTDLQLFRISEDPGLPAATIASDPLPSQFTRSSAPAVKVVGRGRGRVAAETHWDVTGTSPNLVWTQTTGPGTHQGYFRDNNSQKRFGTNRLADIHPNFNGDPGDGGATNFTQDPNKLFEPNEVVSDTTGVFALETPDGITRDIISMITVYDRQTGIGATSLEAQAISGNSGSGLFYNRGTAANPEWELVGIAHAISTFEDQPANTAVYGNATLFSDLSYYNENYPGSLFDIINSHRDYSYMGDVNLNGTVAGTGTGSTATDDVAAFVAGWGSDNGTGVGNVDSWKKGDLNRDGKTDVHDFLKLRSALNGEVSAEAVFALFGSGGVPGTPGGIPEPSAIGQALLGSAYFFLAARRRFTPAIRRSGAI
jgi:hypothetical protein